MTQRIFAAGLAMLWLVLAAGCAAVKPMSFKDASEKLADKKNPIYLMTVTLENGRKKSFQPSLVAVRLAKKTGPDQWENLTFFIDMEGRFLNDTSSSGEGFAARLELEPGEYEIRMLQANSYAFLVNPIFEVPMASPLVAGQERGVYYLGNVGATLRERKGGELPAGPALPLLDQELAGVPGGTFDVRITDQQASDEPIFRSKFPALGQAPIRKAILAPDDRVGAQKVHEAPAR